MTVLAHDKNTVAFDSQATSADMAFAVDKFLLTDKALLVWTGTQSCGLELAYWFKNGEDLAKWPASQAGDDWTRLIVVTNGEIFSYETKPFRMHCNDPYMAYGNGRDYAMGAMAHGADPIEAVAAACRHSVHCGYPIIAFDIKTLKRIK